MPDWFVDVAHNPAAAHTLAEQLAQQPTTGRTLAVAGMLGDKDIEGIAVALRARIDGWIVGGLRGERAIPAQGVAQRLAASGAYILDTAPSIAQACEVAHRLAAPPDRVIGFGSFLTVAEVLDWCDARGVG
jgi:dihydrofolate synthase/folylpolyglutamate synthase